MCGRYSNTGKKGDEFQVRMAQLLGAPQPESDHGYERFNIAPTQEVLVAVDDEHGRRMEHLRWGLIRGRATDANPRFQMINARAESLLERPAYRDLVQQCQASVPGAGRRLVRVAAAGGSEAAAQTAALLARRRRPFCFAGLWTAGASPSCTIVTCEANDLARPIHDRMPVVLTEPADWDAWLDPALDGTGGDRAARAAAVRPAGVRPAHPFVNSSSERGPRMPGGCPAGPSVQLRLSG